MLKNIITEVKEIQMIRNDYRLPAQKQAETKQNQPPLPHSQTLCLAMGRRDERASSNSDVSPSNLPHNCKRTITTNGGGISPQAQDTGMLRAESNCL